MKNLLSHPGDIQSLLRKVEALQKLQRVFLSFLPSPLSAHCKVANYREGVLVIETDSSAWKMQLLYLEPDILMKLRNESAFRGIQALKFYIRPPEAPPKKTKERPRLSPATEHQLSELVSILKTVDTIPQGRKKSWRLTSTPQKEKN